MPTHTPVNTGLVVRAATAIALATSLLIPTGCDDASSGGTGTAKNEASVSRPASVTSVRTADPPPAPQEAKGRPEHQAPTNDAGPTLLNDVLRVVVTDDGLVRYDRFADADLRSALDRVVTWYDRTALPEDRAERLAFLCNAYNANVLARVYRESLKPGFETVVKVPGFFDAKPIRVGGSTMTLNALENEHVRPFGDPRIHAVLVCAAVSCPPLRNEVYRGAKLDEQFDDQCVRWINDPAKFRVVDGKLGLSEILKWYGDDFKKPPYGSPVGFVLAYARADGPVAGFIGNTDPTPTTWLPYDWTLNKK